MIRSEIQAPAVNEEAVTRPAEHLLLPSDTCQLRFIYKVLLSKGKSVKGDGKSKKTLRALFFSVCVCVCGVTEVCVRL